jgi:hypothetical protein
MQIVPNCVGNRRVGVHVLFIFQYIYLFSSKRNAFVTFCIILSHVFSAGYIGSHTVLELLLQKVSNEQHATAPYKVVVVDTLDNSCEESLERVKKLTSASEQLHFRNVDIRDSQGLAKGTKLLSSELKVEIFMNIHGKKISFIPNSNYHALSCSQFSIEICIWQF